MFDTATSPFYDAVPGGHHQEYLVGICGIMSFSSGRDPNMTSKKFKNEDVQEFYLLH
jgi:hypothetical protein